MQGESGEAGGRLIGINLASCAGVSLAAQRVR